MADLAGLDREWLAIERAPISHSIVRRRGLAARRARSSPRTCIPTRAPTAAPRRCRTRSSRRCPARPRTSRVADHQKIDIPEHGMTWERENKQRDPVRLDDEPRGMTARRAPRARAFGVPAAAARRDRARVGARDRGPGRPATPATLHHDALIHSSLPGSSRVAAVPGRLAGDDRRDDAALVPAAGAAFRAASARQPRPRAAMAAFLGGLRGGLDRLRRGRLHRRRRRSTRRSTTSALAARHAWLIAGTHARARRRVPVLAAEGRLPAGVPPSGRLPAEPLRARRRGGLPARPRPRRVLPGLLLGPDAA